MTPINQAFLMLKASDFPERREHSIPRKTLPSIIGDKDEFLADAAKRLKIARLTRPWERFWERRNEEFGISNARQRFPSLRHLENLNERRDREKEVDRARKERKRRDMDSFDRFQEEEREKPFDKEAQRGQMTRAIEQFRHSPKGQELTAMLDAHQKENKIRNITGEERLSLELPEPQISGEERMLLESLRGNEAPLQNLQETQIHEDKFYQPSPPIAVQQPIEQPIGPQMSDADTKFFERLGDLFG